MVKERSRSNRQKPVKSPAAAQTLDAAVRRALVEAREELLHFLMARFRNRDEAEDVLQAFAIRALQNAAQLRDVVTVRGWLGKVLASTIVDHLRKEARRRGKEVGTDPETLPELATEPDPELDAAVCNCLYRLLPTLKSEYAEIVWRADILGEPRDRLAASLGTSLSNVNVRLHRGRQALRKRLEEMCITCPIHGFLDCHCEKASQLRSARALPADGN